jgi:hypothetical protein
MCRAEMKIIFAMLKKRVALSLDQDQTVPARRKVSRFQLGIVCSNPVFDQIEKVFRSDDDLLGFRMRRDGGMVVVDDVALPAASFKKIEEPSAVAPSASRAASHVKRWWPVVEASR